ncbi:MAG TPA: hypothetical protein VK327_16990 [Candidatus Paceibacterota bacterium]|nr:hypothetical protein [Candidatus Paceibacterota bacterium]
MSIFGNVKDRFLEQTALSFLNSQSLAPIGRATSLRIDTTAKSLGIELELKGEATPVSVEISGYEILTEGDRFFLIVQSVQTSREWLTTLAETRFCRRRIEIPEQAGRWLARML